MANEKFCLRWNDFENNINFAFKELRDDKDFFDVTLACEDEQIQAHKVILSACSPFFKSILRRNPHQHPLLYLGNVSYTDLQAVLNFMYQGEVSVAQEELNSFLAVAENLKVKGLTQSQSESKPRKKEQVRNLPTRATSPSAQSKPADRFVKHPPVQEVQEIVPIKSEPRDVPNHAPIHPITTTNQSLYEHHQTSNTNSVAIDDPTVAYADDDYEGYAVEVQGHYEDNTAGMAMSTGMDVNTGHSFQDPSELLQFVRKDPADQKFYCSLCDKFSHKGSYNTRNHVESNHFPNMFSYQCDQCEQTFGTNSNLITHRARKHKTTKIQGGYQQQ